MTRRRVVERLLAALSVLSVREVLVGSAAREAAAAPANTVWAWGANFDGQLGDATTRDRSPAVQVVGGGTGQNWLSGITAVATAGGMSRALAVVAP